MNYLEIQINKLINHINTNNLGFGWKNYPDRTFNGQFKVGEPFDFCIFTKFNKYVFDTKETNKEKWTITLKDRKQGLNLSKCQKVGIEAFFLIYFIDSGKLMKLNINNFFDILSTRKHIRQDDCIEFDYKELIKKG